MSTIQGLGNLMADAMQPELRRGRPRLVPEVGLHADVPFDDYRAWAAASQSTLRRYGQSPLHGRDMDEHGLESTDAMVRGSGLHCYALEGPFEFAQRFAIRPPGPEGNFTTKEGRAWRDARLAEGKAILDKDTNVLGMMEGINRNATARELLRAPGRTELSLAWDEHVPVGESTRVVRCKARLDKVAWWEGSEWIVDLKTTDDARAAAFFYAARKYGMFPQAAWYKRAADVVCGEAPRRYVLIAVETKAPFGVMVHEPDDELVQGGLQDILRWLGIYAEAHATGQFPCYPEGVHPLSAPYQSRREKEEWI
jgi:hypothetical protein